uniref:Uncharacterized protein n=2 Tax=Meloidogyne TaxID=189290 RepID=A0A6V7VJA2_MELEN|nr:unnamed protein product [Meloidogyne enterolobii]
MKSSSPLSAVMLTTVFFLCSAVFFTNVRPQDPPNDETKANVTGSPLSNVTAAIEWISVDHKCDLG